MKAKILNAFPHCAEKNCLEETDLDQFIIFDNSDGKSVIYIEDLTPKYPYFLVKNPRQENVFFLAIDKCILNDGDPKKCDCAIFNDNIFRFIEIKTASSKEKKRSKKQLEAVDQIISTIQIFKAKIDFTGYTLEAHLCVGYFKSTPAFKSTNIYQRQIVNQYSAELFWGNEINI